MTEQTAMAHKAIALGVCRRGLRRSKVVDLQYLGVPEFRRVFKLSDDDPVVGALRPVDSDALWTWLQLLTPEKLDASYVWFVEIVERTSSKCCECGAYKCAECGKFCNADYGMYEPPSYALVAYCSTGCRNRSFERKRLLEELNPR